MAVAYFRMIWKKRESVNVCVCNKDGEGMVKDWQLVTLVRVENFIVLFFQLFCVFKFLKIVSKVFQRLLSTPI